MYQQDQKSLLRKADELIDNRDYDRALSILGDLGSNGLEPEIDLEVRRHSLPKKRGQNSGNN